MAPEAKNGPKQTLSINEPYKTVTREIQESFEEAPLWAAIITYLGYLILNIFGWFRDMLRSIGLEEKKGAKDNNSSVIFNKNFF